MDIPDHSFILLICVFFSAFFSGIETAFVSLSDIRIQHLLEEKKRGISLVKTLKDNYQRLIITILVGNNLVNIAASSIATSIAIDVFKSNAIAIAVGAMTLVILIFGEIIPKNIAIAKNEVIAVASAPIIQALQYILFPIIKLLELFTLFISKPFENQQEPIITESEIKTVVSLGEEAGEVEEDERIMIHNIFRFSDLQVSEIMTDRTQIFSIDAGSNLSDVTHEIIQKGFSRIPVYNNDPDNIAGILYTKDILKAFSSNEDNTEIKNLVRPAMFIAETMLLDDLLQEFQKEKIHIALVADEHGGISGLITIEDVLEEIVGEIYDETDKEHNMIRKTGHSKSIVKGEAEIENVNQELDLNFNEQGDYETISGFILSHLRHIPETGEELKIDNVVIRITKADEKRIVEVEIEKRLDIEESSP
ncbi:MAG: HlyC/CorC family transporter [Deltaproteobacteria bacterium]|nr:HlyC/CorC family transporter [Deltaproteobacteria bacterium]